MIWYVDNPLRSHRERENLEALVSSVDWLRPVGWRIDSSVRLIWDVDIVVDGQPFHVSMRYPNHFPHSPPLVLPRGEFERWSSHQYGDGGELCLEFGPDNWHPELTGADMIQSAYRLLHGELPAPDRRERVASRHSTTLGQDLRSTTLRLVVTRGLRECLETLPEDHLSQGTIIGRFHSHSLYLLVGTITHPAGGKWVDEAIPPVLAKDEMERALAILRWPATVSLPPAENLDAFRAALAHRGIELPDVPYVLIAHGAALCAYLLWKEDKTVTPITIVPAQRPEKRLDESHNVLKDRKVAVIGCGSLGSKLAVMLARSGVGKFLLVDDDVMLPDNLVRNELDWRDIGMHKTTAVARRIQMVNSGASVKTREHRLGGQESSGSIETLISSIAACDLVIDASANGHVFNYLCAAVAVGKKPLLWAEVFGGGYGGLVARHRPAHEPDPATMRHTIESWCAERGTPIERAEDYQTRGSGPPLIADDADVTVIAGHAARMAIDTLIPREPSAFRNSVYLIGLAEKWNFEQAFDTYPIDLGPPRPSAAEPVPQEIADQERARVLELLKNYADASASADGGTPASSG